jgi:hypothetical protein
MSSADPKWHVQRHMAAVFTPFVVLLQPASWINCGRTLCHVTVVTPCGWSVHHFTVLITGAQVGRGGMVLPHKPKPRLSRWESMGGTLDSSASCADVGVGAAASLRPSSRPPTLQLPAGVEGGLCLSPCERVSVRLWRGARA